MKRAGEKGAINLYGFVVNTPVNAVDLLGLAERTVRYAGKSFILGIGPIGSLGDNEADQRLTAYASAAPALAKAIVLIQRPLPTSNTLLSLRKSVYRQ